MGKIEDEGNRGSGKEDVGKIEDGGGGCKTVRMEFNIEGVGGGYSIWLLNEWTGMGGGAGGGAGGGLILGMGFQANEKQCTL